MKSKSYHKPENILGNSVHLKILILLFVISVGIIQKASAENKFELYSPDKKIRIQLTVEKTIQFSLLIVFTF